jgi:hypothetical protein
VWCAPEEQRGEGIAMLDAVPMSGTASAMH